MYVLMVSYHRRVLIKASDIFIKMKSETRNREGGLWKGGFQEGEGGARREAGSVQTDGPVLTLSVRGLPWQR